MLVRLRGSCFGLANGGCPLRKIKRKGNASRQEAKRNGTISCRKPLQDENHDHVWAYTPIVLGKTTRK